MSESRDLVVSRERPRVNHDRPTDRLWRVKSICVGAAKSLITTFEFDFIRLTDHKNLPIFYGS